MHWRKYYLHKYGLINFDSGMKIIRKNTQLQEDMQNEVTYILKTVSYPMTFYLRTLIWINQWMKAFTLIHLPMCIHTSGVECLRTYCLYQSYKGTSWILISFELWILQSVLKFTEKAMGSRVALLIDTPKLRSTEGVPVIFLITKW